MKTLHTLKDLKLQSRHNQKPFIFDARYFESNKKKPLIVFVHGFKGFKDWGFWNLISERFAQEEYVFVKLNLSHNGTTPEHPVDFVDLEAFAQNNFTIELDDIDVLLNHLTSTSSPIPADEVDLNRIYLIGHSRGGGLVILKAAEDERVKKVVAWAPVHDLKERYPEYLIKEWKEKGVIHVPNSRTGQNMPMYYQLVEDVLQNTERLDIPKAVKKMKQPLLIVHGTEDPTLPYKHSHEMASWNSGSQLYILEGGNHTFGGTHPFTAVDLPLQMEQVVSKTLDFLND